ncbi:MAG TPA: porin family protein [Candidatus Didemnitutus sp.]|nr:porin family protein [Candidatus Didemnitutus sp.]
MIFLVFAGIRVHLEAQDTTNSSALALHVRIGGCVGAPIPVGNVPPGSTGSPVPGFIGGATLDVPLTSVWTVSIEPQFVRYEATFDTPLEDQPYIDKVAITTPDGSTTVLEVNTTFTGQATGAFITDYVQLPVLARFEPGYQWGLLAGGYVGWMIQTQSNATGVGTVGIRPEVVTRNLEFGERMQGFDIGLQLGGQFRVFDDLRLDLRGVYGLTSIFSQDFATVDRTVQNVFVHLTVGFRLM